MSVVSTIADVSPAAPPGSGPAGSRPADPGRPRRRRTSSGAAGLMAAALAIAVFLASLTLRHLTQDHYVVPSLVTIVVIMVLTALARRLRLPAAGVLVAQVLTLSIVLAVTVRSLVTPGAGYLASLAGFFPMAAEHMRTQSAPMEPNPGVLFLLVATVGVITIVTDVLAVPLRRPAWTIAPLVTLYLVSALALPGDIGVISFVLIAVGYLLVLAVEGVNRTNRWTRGLTSDSAAGIGHADPVVARAAGLIGVPAILIAVVLALVTPMASLSGFFNTGTGPDGPLQLTNPTVDLKRNLTLPENKVVLRYTTDLPGGAYLRMAVLPVFNSRGWGLTSINIASGRLPTPPGYTMTLPTTTTFTIAVDTFDTEYLPVPWAPESISTSAGRWGWDPESLMVVSTDHSSISDLRYTVQAAVIQPGDAALARQSAGQPADANVTTAIPDDLPPRVRQLTDEITAGHTGAAAKAAAIQAYLRGSAFTYSTQPQPGTGYDALERFLFVDHLGYCEQFASAMALMARIAGIPSRVVVGFLPGTRQNDGSYVVTGHNMHAWPELYFTGYGWVRYEPTPSIATAPGWTLPQSSSAPSETAAPSDGPSVTVQNPTTGPSAPDESGAATATVDTGASVVPVLLAIVIALLVMGVLALPALLRIRQRTTRLRRSGRPGERVEAAWSEVRATRVDLQAVWPSGSPRTIARSVGEHLESSDAEALSQLAVLVERARYSRDFDGRADQAAVGAVAGLAGRLRRAFTRGLPRGRRLRAVVLPRSLWLLRRRGRRE